MRIIVLSCLILLLAYCQADTKNKVLLTAEVVPNRPLQEDLEASKSATTNQALTLRMGEATAKKGETVCLPIVAQNFKNLIGLQYTIQWDSTQLDFHSVRAYGLPGYGPANFGDRFANRGYLSTLWTESTLQGTTLPEGSKLFELCLTNQAPKGKIVPVKFTNGPTTFEVVAADMTQWKFRYANGRVVSK